MNKRALILHQMWMSGASAEEIGRRFGIAGCTVYDWVKRYKLPPREKRGEFVQRTADPTPSEIEERAAYCRRMREAGTPIGGV